MDDGRFDELTRALDDLATRRGALGWVLGVGALLGLAAHGSSAAARRKKKKTSTKGPSKNKQKSGKTKNKKKARCPSTRDCNGACCPRGGVCCDPQAKLCCAAGAECCNPGEGTEGPCCSSPHRCGKPWGNDAAPWECCPPERQWFTTVGLVRCCPPGTRALEGITSDDGPCCPEEKVCGDTCCGDLAPVCVDPSTQRCCTEEAKCGNACCGISNVCADPAKNLCCPTGSSACGNGCCSSQFCMDCVGGNCVEKCGFCQFCDGAGNCLDCGVGCCGG